MGGWGTRLLGNCEIATTTEHGSSRDCVERGSSDKDGVRAQHGKQKAEEGKGKLTADTQEQRRRK